MAELVDWLQAFRPDQINAYATVLEQLALCALSGGLRIAPEKVIGLAEPVTNRLGRLVRAAWGVGLTNVYGATEGLALAVSAPGGEHLQVVEDLAVLESVDAEHRPVPRGVIGDYVLLTGLCNRAFPLIRYELTDRLAILPAFGGRKDGGLCLSPPRGRSDRWFVYEGRVRLHPSVVRVAMDAVTEIEQYQVRQTLSGLDIRVRTVRSVDLEPLRRRLAVELQAAGLAAPVVTIRSVPTIERDRSTGKVQVFVNLPGAR
jgi:phenylacetate-coenzyme A ligase PaaK-like adenylate-forming protein